MSIDISQFHGVFFEESFEGLDAMESGLLNLDVGAADIEEINTIFRAAHSIKGGAGTFGFMDVSEFTHVMETMLDQMRNGEREVTKASVSLLLKAVDVLREMLTAAQMKTDVDEVRIEDVRQQLEHMLAGGEMNDIAINDIKVEKSETSMQTSRPIGWKIEFRPHVHLFKTGNDPVRMFRELNIMGELSVKVDDNNLPPFSDLEPEYSYLAWQLMLRGDIQKNDVEEIFEWVDEDCDLTIEPLIGEIDVLSEQSALAEDQSETIVAVEALSSEPIPQPSQTLTTKPKVMADELLDSSTAPVASIRVGTDKVDSLLNLVGELVITQSMLSQIGENFLVEMLPKLIDGLAQLERNTRELQEGVMRIRMLPISFAFNRFPRLVHDMSSQSGKKVELKLSGEQTEIDKTVMEKIGDPLVHLVRNSLDHGLETPEVRIAAGKDEIGTIALNAYQQGGNIIVEIKDDGAGLDETKIFNKAVEKGLINASDELSLDKIHELIFLPGFSTADAVTDISGRGVGMDVVRKNINSLNGSVDVSSIRGVGTTFTIRLPLTLAIMDGQILRVADEIYIIPLISIIETLEVNVSEVKQVTGKGELYPLREDYVPIIRMYDIFNLAPRVTDLEEGLLIIVEGAGQKVGLFIDQLLGQQQVVIKSLKTNYRKVMGISGATILGDGTVALILDIQGLIALYRDPSLAKKVLAHNEQAA